MSEPLENSDSSPDTVPTAPVQIAHVGLRYGSGPEILRDIRLVLEKGSFHFLTGPSGAGKTSLMRLISLDLLPTRGKVEILGKDTRRCSRSQRARLRQRVGVVFQDFRLFDHMSVLDNIALPLILSGQSWRKARPQAQEWLNRLDLGARAAVKPSSLSGGQQQRVAIARAAIHAPDILVADEPTGSLDNATAESVMAAFEMLNQSGTTILLATHSESLLHAWPHPRLALQDGEVQTL